MAAIVPIGPVNAYLRPSCHFFLCKSYVSHRIIGPVNAYLRPSCHFFLCKSYVSKIDLDLNLSQAAIVFKKSIVFTFSHVKAFVSKIDLTIK